MSAIAEIAAADWDACAGAGNPFVSHAFLERAGGQRLGQRAHRLAAAARGAARRGRRRSLAVAPMYVKSHSYGEYVFDHGWANALERAGGQLLSEAAGRGAVQPGDRAAAAAPAGRRRCRSRPLARALQQACASLDTVLRPRHLLHRGGMGRRWARPAGCSASACSSIGRTQGYASFDDFLGALSSRKRKVLRRERRDAQAAGLEFARCTGGDLTERALGRVLSLLHVDRRTANGASAYLTRGSSRCWASGWATGWC